MKFTLEEIACKYDNDKSIGKKDGTGHGYTLHYEKAFESFRDKPIKLLEIGVASGPSIQMWLDYFRNGKIYGVDFVYDTNEWNTVGAKTHERYTFVRGDQTDPTLWKCFAVDYGIDWDIIIDDGGHCNDGIIISFEGLWPILKSGGVYCIEDLAVSYGAGSIFVKKGFPNHIDWLRDKIDQMNTTSSDIDSIYFAKELCVMRKK